MSGIMLLTRESRMRYRAHRPNGELPCGIEVNAMPKKVTRKTNRKQRRNLSDRIDKIAAAIYWVVKTVLLIVEWLSR